MFSTIEYLASLIDGRELRDIDSRFDDHVADEFLSATNHLGTILCEEADGIYASIMYKMKIEYVRDLFKQFVPVNEKFLALATEISFIARRPYFEQEALHNGYFSDEDYFEFYGYCELENQYEANWRELNEICRYDGMPYARHAPALIALKWARPLISDSDWQTILEQEDDEDYPDVAFGTFIIFHLNEPWAFDAAATGKKYEYPGYWPNIVESIKWKVPAWAKS